MGTNADWAELVRGVFGGEMTEKEIETLVVRYVDQRIDEYDWERMQAIADNDWPEEPE